MRTSALFLATVVLIVARGLAQHDHADNQRFEVVSVKQAALTDDERASTVSRIGMCARDYVELSDRNVRLPASTLCGLIRLAYDANDYEVVSRPTSSVIAPMFESLQDPI